jgi:hypothetical protein
MLQSTPATNVRRQIQRDADLAEVPRRLAWAVFWLPLAGLAGLLLIAVIFRPAYDRLLQEDYPVEWAQFDFCVFTCVVSALAARRFHRQRQIAIAVTLVLLCLGTFVLAGEEISWGQRILGIATPADRAGVNAQSEMNLHNVTVGFDVESMFRQISLLIGIVGAVVPLLTRCRPAALTSTYWKTLSPPLFTAPLFAMMIGYRIYRIFDSGEIPFVVRMQEWIEFCQYLGLVITVTVVYLKVRATDELTGTAGHAGHAGNPGRPTLPTLPTLPTPRSGARDPLRTLTIISSVIIAVTLVFAVLSALSGIRAGNAQS